MIVTDNQFPLLDNKKQTQNKNEKAKLNIQLGDLEHYSSIME